MEIINSEAAAEAAAGVMCRIARPCLARCGAVALSFRIHRVWPDAYLQHRGQARDADMQVSAAQAVSAASGEDALTAPGQGRV